MAYSAWSIGLWFEFTRKISQISSFSSFILRSTGQLEKPNKNLYAAKWNECLYLWLKFVVMCFTLEFKRVWLCKRGCVLIMPAERGKSEKSAPKTMEISHSLSLSVNLFLGEKKDKENYGDKEKEFRFTCVLMKSINGNRKVGKSERCMDKRKGGKHCVWGFCVMMNSSLKEELAGSPG